MSYFKGLKLTKLGETLLANINGNLNETLTFTSGEIGAGIINSDDEIRFLTTLKEKWKDLDIISIEKDEKDETIVKLELQFSNIDLKEAKIFREIGIYAKGNNGEPVLFAYSNAGENYDYIPLPQDNPQNFTIQINLKITSNSKIDAIINMAGFVTIGKMIEYLKNKLTQISTIAELQSRKNLKVGDIVEVLGYYSAGDGAGHKRIIANEDDGSGVQLNNKLWANIVHNGKVNVSWFGAKGDGVTDDGIYLKKVFKTPNIRKVIFDKQKLNIINERNIEIPSTIKEIDFALCKISVDTSKGIPQEDWVTRNPVFSIKEQRNYTSLNTQELSELNNLNNTIYKNSITFKGIEKYGDDIVYRMFGTNDKNLEFYDCNLHMRYGTISSPFRYGVNNIDRLRYRKLNKEPLVIKNLNFELTGINNQRMFCFLYITKDNVVLDNCYIDYEYNDLNNRKNLITFEDSVNVQINNLNAPQPIDNGLISEQKYDGYIVLMNDCGNVTLNDIKCRMPLHFIDNDLSSINTTCSLNIATNDTFEIYVYNSKIGKIDSHVNGFSMYFYNSVLSLVQNRGGGKIEFNSCTLQLMHGYQRELFHCNNYSPKANSYSQGAQICDYEIVLNNCILEYSNNVNQERSYDRYCLIRLDDNKELEGIVILPTVFINNCIFDFRHINAPKALFHPYYIAECHKQLYGGDVNLNNIVVLHEPSLELTFEAMFVNDNSKENIVEKKDGVIKVNLNNIKGIDIRPLLLSRNTSVNKNFINEIEFLCNECSLIVNTSGIGITNLTAKNCKVNDFKIEINIGSWHFINSDISITDYYRVFSKENSKLRFDYCNFKQSEENDFDKFARAVEAKSNVLYIEFNNSILENYKDFDLAKFNKEKTDYQKLLFKRIHSMLQKYNSKIKNFGIYEVAMNQSQANAVTKYDYYFNAKTGTFELPQQTIIAQVQQLNSIYHLEKMKQENVYDDYIAYMDEKTVYDKEQKEIEKQRMLSYQEALQENPELTYEEFMSVQPMTLNLVEEPQPSEALKKFMEKYL